MYFRRKEKKYCTTCVNEALRKKGARKQTRKGEKKKVTRKQTRKRNKKEERNNEGKKRRKEKKTNEVIHWKPRQCDENRKIKSM